MFTYRVKFSRERIPLLYNAMTKKFVDCFMLMGTALSLRGGQRLPEMGRPLLQDVTTTTVNISLDVQEFRIFDHDSLQIELGVLLNQKWVDPRLGANVNTRRMAVAGQIWKPKIVNLNGERRICNNDDTMFWRGFGSEGNVLLSEKIKLKIPCTWDYRKFPFDTQICELKFGSFRFPQDEVTLLWDSAPVQITTDLSFNEFIVFNITTYSEVDLRCSGNFSSGVIQFVLKRRSGHHVQCIIVPSVFVTMLNYISFWFDLNSRSKRLYLNLSAFGFMLYFYYTSVCLPYPTPYLKALDVFVLICESFALITLIETVLVDIICTAEETQFHLKKLASAKEYPKSVFWLEFGMKLSYPVFYVFFVILYGLVYF